MAMNSIRSIACARAARELRAANGANVTITFALATIPMVGFVGAAVDYSHANSVKAAMQAAADSTALMLSKDAAALTNAQLQTKANDYFKALFTRPEATGLTVTATYTTTGGSQVVVNAIEQREGQLHGPDGRLDHEGRRRLAGEVGQHQAARRARARHHRLDGRRRQDGRAQDRDQEPARPAQGRRRQERRRLRLDHPVQQGRQRRQEPTTTQTWIDWDRNGTTNNGDDVSTTTCTNERQEDEVHDVDAPGCRTTTTPGTAA